MKIGMKPSSYVSAWGFDKGIAKMASHGFECIDYQDFINTETAFFKSGAVSFDRALRAQRAVFEREGLFVHQAHAPFRFPIKDGTPEDRAERLEAMKKSLEGAATLGAGILVMHPLSPFSLEYPDVEEDSAKINAEFISRLADHARPLGITVCVENLPFVYFSLSPCNAVNSFVRSLSLDNVKACLDTGHTNYTDYVKNTLGIGFENCTVKTCDEAVRLFGEMLGACHVHQNYGDRDAHAPLDEGNIDMRAFADALFDVGYKGVFSLEVTLHFESHPESEWDDLGKKLFGSAKALAVR